MFVVGLVGHTLPYGRLWTWPKTRSVSSGVAYGVAVTSLKFAVLDASYGRGATPFLFPPEAPRLGRGAHASPKNWFWKIMKKNDIGKNKKVISDEHIPWPRYTTTTGTASLVVVVGAYPNATCRKSQKLMKFRRFVLGSGAPYHSEKLSPPQKMPPLS